VTVRVNLEGLKLNDTRQLLVSADNISLLADSVYVIRREERRKERKKKKEERKKEKKKEGKKERKKERKKEKRKEGKKEGKKERKTKYLFQLVDNEERFVGEADKV
jgi:hypothetical protein